MSCWIVQLTLRWLKSISRPLKTDPFHKGVSVFLGRTGSVLCPVLALAAYLASRGPQLGPFFLIEGRPLTREVFVAKVREALSEAGFDPLSLLVIVLGLGQLRLRQVEGWRTL